MTTVTKETFKKEIKKAFKAGTGLSITEAKKKIKNQLKINEYDNQIRTGNIKLMYTSNPNYGGGVSNGWGKGWYISNVTMSMGGSEIRI